MKFTSEYSKLKKQKFTTIRKNRGYYKVGANYLIGTPEQTFIAQVIDIQAITKSQITDELALDDADCTANELKNKLETWYGKQYDNFILLTLRRMLTFRGDREA